MVTKSKANLKTKACKLKILVKMPWESRADYLNNVVNANKWLFSPGNTFNATTLSSLLRLDIRPQAKAYRDLQYNAFKKLTAYTDLNKVLALRGIAIQSGNYYESYKVIAVNDAPKRVLKYEQGARSKYITAKTYKKGVENFKGKWSLLTTSEVKEAAQTFHTGYNTL